MHNITKEFSFEAAHILCGHGGECINLHGHSYRLLVEVAGEITDGMVMDFSDLKRIVKTSIIDKIDHSFIYNKNSTDPAENDIATILLRHKKKVFVMENRPTAENMSQLFYRTLKPLVIGKCAIKSVVLYETETSFCKYSEED